MHKVSTLCHWSGSFILGFIVVRASTTYKELILYVVLASVTATLLRVAGEEKMA